MYLEYISPKPQIHISSKRTRKNFHAAPTRSDLSLYESHTTVSLRRSPPTLRDPVSPLLHASAATLSRMHSEEECRAAIFTIVMFNMLLVQLCMELLRIEYEKQPRSAIVNRILERHNHLHRLLMASDRTCHEQIRMRTAPFLKLVNRLRGFGLIDNRSVTVEEQVALFLGTIAHDSRYRCNAFNFYRSGETLSRYFHIVLDAVLQLYKEVVSPAQPHNSPADGGTERDWHHYFKDAVGAIDGTHFKANVPQLLQARYRNRHATISQNVLLGCTFDMKFTYVLAGWEGSAHDGRLLRDAVSRNGNRLTLPSGKYYLADAGFPSSRGFLTPYRGVRYHLRDQQGRRPQNARELFNYRHSSLRNVVERTIGILKKRFAYLRNNTFHNIRTQSKIILACAAIHNFLRDEDLDDMYWDLDDFSPNTQGDDYME